MIEVKEYGLKVFGHNENPPEGAIWVGSPSLFMNPFNQVGEGPIHIEQETEAEVRAFKLYANLNKIIPEHAKEELRGKHLVCGCLNEPCHAVVLMELANDPN